MKTMDSAVVDEESSLLPRAPTQQSGQPEVANHRTYHFLRHDEQGSRLKRISTIWVMAIACLAAGANFIGRNRQDELEEDDFVWTVPLLGRKHDDDPEPEPWDPPTPRRRCDWVVSTFRERDVGDSEEVLSAKYNAQTPDVNVFYRATAMIFWKDFVQNGWGHGLRLGQPASASIKGVPLNEKATWTWITGDQHLSNFGAWRNRHGKVVFGVNDFDEAAVFDFQVDVFRVAVSICNHAVTNGFSKNEVDEILHVFTKSYVDTCVSYTGNERALLFELTPDTSYGYLQEFLNDVEYGKTQKKLLSKFTKEDKKTGMRRFIKGTVHTAHEDTRLAAVPPEMEKQIREAFVSTRYGATQVKLGWAVPDWNDDFFTVLDVAARLGSGIGSFGVSRFYVLLKGTDKLLNTGEGGAIILDVKYEPPCAFAHVLSPDFKARYDVVFLNEADRAVRAQSALTSYTDPFIGWFYLTDSNNETHPFYVRQRSPWKQSPDLDSLTSVKDFKVFIEQVAIATATSHVRGTVAKAPGDFKHVIKALLGKKSHRDRWSIALARLAHAYQEQVKLDFKCFQEFVRDNYPATDSVDDSDD